MEDFKFMKTFEEYMQDAFYESSASDGYVKDQIEDAFDSFLSDLDGNEYMEYAQEYGDWILKVLKEKVQKYTDPKPEYDGITWDNIINNRYETPKYEIPGFEGTTEALEKLTIIKK